MIATSKILKPIARRESPAPFYRRLRTMLAQLEKLQYRLPRDEWRRFVKAYCQHWQYSAQAGEVATLPAAFYAEWAQIEQLGRMPINGDTESFHNARHYPQYESPRAQARRVLGLYGGDQLHQEDEGEELC